MLHDLNAFGLYDFVNPNVVKYTLVSICEHTRYMIQLILHICHFEFGSLVATSRDCINGSNCSHIFIMTCLYNMYRMYKFLWHTRHAVGAYAHAINLICQHAATSAEQVGGELTAARRPADPTAGAAGPRHRH